MKRCAALAIMAILVAPPFWPHESGAAAACGGRAVTMSGTPGDDVLIGTPDDDVIAGLDGDDVIHGGDGDDVLCGGDGDDVIAGQVGDDLLIGGPGEDLLLGADGADRLHGGSGIDELIGGAGPDLLLGGADNDLLRGAAGDDLLDGDAGDDDLRGGKGDDRLIGWRGRDRLHGGPGDDIAKGGRHRDRCPGAEWPIGCERPVPVDPGDAVDCDDFATAEAAQRFFDRHLPAYGDVALLDLDGDGQACESLAGSPGFEQSPASSPIALGRGSHAGFVVDEDAGLVAAFRAGRVRWSTPVGTEPRTVAVDQRRGRVYVAVRGDDRIVALDRRTGAIVAETPTGFRPFGVVLHPDGDRLFVTEEGDSLVAEYDAATLGRIGDVEVGERPRGIAITTGGDIAVVTHWLSGDVTLIDIASGAGVTVLNTGRGDNAVSSVAIHPDGTRAFIPHQRARSTNPALTFDTTLSPRVSVVDVKAAAVSGGDLLLLALLHDPVRRLVGRGDGVVRGGGRGQSGHRGPRSAWCRPRDRPQRRPRPLRPSRRSLGWEPPIPRQLSIPLRGRADAA